jgi:hypothetical protein
MKELLFSVLNDLEVYELLEVRLINSEVMYIPKESPTLPLAIRMNIARGEEPMPEYDPTNYTSTVNEFLENHTITIDNENFIIEKELIDVVYYNDYIYTKENYFGDIIEHYVPYTSIKSLTKCDRLYFSADNSCLVKKYNKLQYIMATNE